MAGKADDVRLPFSVMDSVIGDVFSVLWEPDMMREMGTAIRIIGTEALTQGAQQLLGATIMTGLMGALQLPMILTKLSYFIDNPWLNALDRAKAAGLVLADVLINRHAGVRPTSLIGFSLGARVIFYALLELARHKAYGIVQDVYLFGATVTVARDQWLQARSVVGGRFVNGYSSRDWVLGYLFRATTGGLSSIAGLAPVESVHGIENIEVTDLVNGHMRYRSSMPLLLKRVGIPVTADKFDEPDVSGGSPFADSRTPMPTRTCKNVTLCTLTTTTTTTRRRRRCLVSFPGGRRAAGLSRGSARLRLASPPTLRGRLRRTGRTTTTSLPGNQKSPRRPTWESSRPQWPPPTRSTKRQSSTSQRPLVSTLLPSPRN